MKFDINIEIFLTRTTERCVRSSAQYLLVNDHYEKTHFLPRRGQQCPLSLASTSTFHATQKQRNQGKIFTHRNTKQQTTEQQP